MALLHVSYKAYSLHRTVNFRVILPMEDTHSYSPDPQDKPKRFKTLYLLHGYSGDCGDWLYGSRIFKLARDRNLAVVMPDGENGFYEDDPVRGLLYRQFVGEELVAATRRMFPLSHRREDTFIGGNSMGGFGSLLAACTYPETFGRVFCLSGAFMQTELLAGSPSFRALVNEGADYPRHIFGTPEQYPGSGRDPVALAARAAEQGQMPRLLLSCGQQDPLYPCNLRTRDALRARNVPLCWEEAPGGHDWPFWDARLPQVLDWLLEGENEHV